MDIVVGRQVTFQCMSYWLIWLMAYIFIVRLPLIKMSSSDYGDNHEQGTKVKEDA